MADVSMGRISPKVWLVGAGPGNPDLLTVRALRLIESADIIFYDALVSDEILALASTQNLVPVGKRAGQISTKQEFINRSLVAASRQHCQVVRLKGGDPMVFGRAQEEIDALRAVGVAVEVVPGITAAIAASASLGISLTRRGVARSVAFATAASGVGESPSNGLDALLPSGTSAIYMGKAERQATARQLLANGWTADTPAVLVENVSRPDQQVFYTTLAGLLRSEFSLRGPTLLLLGEVFNTRAAQEVSVNDATHTLVRAVATSRCSTTG